MTNRFRSTLLLALGFAAPLALSAADDPAKHLREHVAAESGGKYEPKDVDVEPIENEAIAEAFAAPVFKVVASGEKGMKSISFAAVHEGEVLEIDDNRSAVGKKSLSTILAEDFRIEGRAGAERLGKAISSIFASDFITDEGEMTVIEHEDGWILAHSESFGDVKGYRVGVGEDGKVGEIAFDPELPVDAEQLE